MAILRGLAGLKQGKPERRWTRSAGWVTVIPYIGTEGDCNAAVPGAQADPLVTEASVRQRVGPIYELVVVYGNDGITQENDLPTNWELLPEEEQKPLTDIKLYADLSNDDKEAINESLEKFRRGETPTSSISTNPNAQLFYETGKLVDSYPVNRWVLRKTQSVSSWQRIRFNSPADGSSDLDITLRGVGTVFTTAQLTAYESGMWSSIKTAIEYYQSPGNILIGSTIIMRWGWYKKLPTLSVRAGNKLEAVQDYALGYWPAIAVSAYA